MTLYIDAIYRHEETCEGEKSAGKWQRRFESMLLPSPSQRFPLDDARAPIVTADDL